MYITTQLLGARWGRAYAAGPAAQAHGGGGAGGRGPRADERAVSLD
jgi:hypothetical protein